MHGVRLRELCGPFDIEIARPGSHGEGQNKKLGVVLCVLIALLKRCLGIWLGNYCLQNGTRRKLFAEEAMT